MIEMSTLHAICFRAGTSPSGGRKAPVFRPEKVLRSLDCSPIFASFRSRVHRWCTKDTASNLSVRPAWIVGAPLTSTRWGSQLRLRFLAVANGSVLPACINDGFDWSEALLY